MIAWHYLKEDMRSGAGSSRQKPWREGESRTIRAKKLFLCKTGYHSSPTPFDGLQYAPGPVLCLVEISEPEARDATKSVSRTRRLIKALDLSRELRLFACDVAEEVLKLAAESGLAVDERSRTAIDVSRRFANGLASREELYAANSAAYYAANSAANYAANSAANSAAYYAANSAAKEKINALVEPLFAEAMASVD